jgi:hypothetical protein
MQIIEAVDAQVALTNAARSELLDVAFIYFFNQFRTYACITSMPVLVFVAELTSATRHTSLCVSSRGWSRQRA